MPPTAATPSRTGARQPDRRARRREQTRDEILDHALHIMAEDGVAGLTMARLARAMDIRPPSLYKYYPSLLAVYDALFRRGQLANLEALRDGMRDAAPGLEAVARGMQAAGRWAVANPVLAQLLFWHPVPGYQPSAEAFGPALQIIDLLRSALAGAAALGQVHPDAATDAGMELLSILHFGIISQHLANDPGTDWEHGRYTRHHQEILSLFVTAYPPGESAPVL
jgi:AcrR family transcriptional regulator